MKYEILYKDACPLIKVNLEHGEKMKAESGAMVSMSTTIDVTGKAEGGIMKGLGRMLAGEKFFFQILDASRGAGEVLLAPATIGSISDVVLDGSYDLCVQKDGFLAATEHIEVESKMQNLTKGLFSGEGFFVVNIKGKGTVFLNSLGAVHSVEIPAGEEVIIDNSHLVAWPNYMKYTIEKASKTIMSSLTSGEGLVCKFQGPGTVLIQSRNPEAFGSWLKRFIPAK